MDCFQATKVKQCNVCGKIRRLLDFHKNRHRLDGRKGHCSDCDKLRRSAKFHETKPTNLGSLRCFRAFQVEGRPCEINREHKFGPFKATKICRQQLWAKDPTGWPWKFKYSTWDFVPVKQGKAVMKRALEKLYWEDEVNKAV